jgi:hypothetical protein
MPRETSTAKISSLSASFLAFALILALSACGGGGSSSGNPLVKSISITPTAANVQINTTINLTAMVTLSTSTGSADTAVTWQVNGIAGGNASVGTILTSSADDQVGVYTAPSVTPVDNNHQVMITATAPQDPSNTTNTTIITSNTSIITVGVGQGLAVSPTTATVPAGGTFQFSALLNNVADSSATWTVTSTNANCTTSACVGAINRITGLYTAPSNPPPGASITVTATDSTLTPAITASATATIVFSDQSLSGPFAFSYTGSDQSGFLAAAGSFVADGNGHIVSGIEDIDSFSAAGPSQFQISGTYKVGPDGRGSILLNPGISGAGTLQFALTTNQHAVVIRFDRSFTGSGSIDQQDLNDLSTISTITGPYVFSGSGADRSFLPLGIAGKFSASGNGSLQGGTGVVDLNDNGALKPDDKSLTVSYSLDSTAPDTGRGEITLTSTATGPRLFAFYIIDATHLYFVEIDGNGYLRGDIYSSAPGSSFSASSLTAGNYPFTAGGTSPTGAFALGGVFASGGNGNVSGGIFDSNNAGTVTSATALGTCTYTVDPATGRILLGLNLASGACPAGASASTAQFAAYQTAQASSTTVEPAVVMLEIDAAAVSTGSAYLQKATAQFTAGSFAMLLGGQGISHNEPASVQQDVEGQLNLSSSTVSSGNLDINNFNAVFQNDPISSTSSSILAPDSNGRGTAVLVTTNPNSSYNLAYYVIDANTALLLDTDSNHVLIGAIARQF